MNIDEAMKILTTKGAFLNVKNGEELNTMAISWGAVGYMWSRKVFIAMVRESRFTHHIITSANDFTVSIPLDDSLKKELAHCGAFSGRNENKFETCNLKTKNSKKVETPVIDGNVYNVECIIKMKTTPEFSDFVPDILNSFYKDNDKHTFIFGEIVENYA